MKYLSNDEDLAVYVPSVGGRPLYEDRNVQAMEFRMLSHERHNMLRMREHLF